ncbi:hypothetical protein H2200_009527 [Cladophialophora chaetospira]|uniref:Sterigmatocystin biosynthesis monooxygenase stcW n=1 Tax=Cladophialophora chaetospira TaxID=386627 RepID=A0AA39CET9_9EURO|nr:hypothetical protein H2200_009527 [Cladophialophora chaetospira]
MSPEVQPPQQGLYYSAFNFTSGVSPKMTSSIPTLASMTWDSILKDKIRHCRRPPAGKPLFAERHVRIICVGAGASGLCFAYKLQRSFQNFSLTIYEKNEDISGTWFENRYPGCACDVPGHNYTYSWEPSPETSAVYISSQEIFRYFERFAVKYGLHKFIRLQHEVVDAMWKENSWHIQIKDNESQQIFEDECDIFINATGILNNWKWPDIPGLRDFKGTLLHSAQWNSSVFLKGKTVGLIGNGSSGIQILPAIQPEVKKVVTFVRGPTWVSPTPGLDQHRYTSEEKTIFTSNIEELTRCRKMNETALNCLFGIFCRGSDTQSDTRADLTQQMHRRLNDPELSTRLIPQWSPGCRRLTPGINYLETLGKTNVQVEFGEVSRITESGCVGPGGTEHDLDVLICATGFDVSFKPRFPVVGLAGNLQQSWETDPRSYFGTLVADVPNYMLFLGPSCPVGNGPLIPAIETQADYMLQWVDRWQTENIVSFYPKREVVDDFVDHINEYMPKTVWTEQCRSWYKNKDGRIIALWPGSTLHFMEVMQYPRYDDFVVTYKGNRFEWMGNGYSQTELDVEADWAYYIRDVDDSPFLGKTKRRRALVGESTLDPKMALEEEASKVNGTDGSSHRKAPQRGLNAVYACTVTA